MKNWIWTAGMRNANSKFARILRVSDDEICAAEEGASEDDNFAIWVDSPIDMEPDLFDPATTTGCLVGVVRRIWKLPYLTAIYKGGKWMFYSDDKSLPDAIYVLREDCEVDLWSHALSIGIENELF